MSKWLKEPLLHFILLGALIFFVYGKFSNERSADEIFISSGQQDNLINTFSRTWQRPPTTAEFKGLLDDFVREEIAYREGAALGLDDDDIIIRRRMRQKLELLAEDVASLSQPGDEQLQAFLDEHAEDYRIEDRLSLQQIYFSPDRREDAVADATAQLAVMNLTDASIDIESLGDPIPLPGEIDGLRKSEIARLFGSVFAEQLENVETTRWAGPIESGFGFHLVFVKERIQGGKPDLNDVRDAVQRDWFSQRRREAVDGLYARLAENYQIEIEPPPKSVSEDSAADSQVDGQ
jgi:hypothetical protein